MSQRASTNPWVVLVLICIAQFMVVLDATIVNVALPSIQKDLGLSEANLQWIINAYTLVFGGFLLLGGRAGDLLGRKRLFLIGLVIFTTASLLNGLASSAGQLIGVPRPPGPRRRARSRPPRSRSSRRRSRRAASGRRRSPSGPRSRSAASAVGLVLGGALDAVLLVAVDLLRQRPGRASSRSSSRRCASCRSRATSTRTASYDIAGAVTVTGGLMTLVYAIVKAETDGWTSATTIGFFVLVGASCSRAFVLIELRGARRRSCGSRSSGSAR